VRVISGGSLTSAAGFRAAGVACGVKPEGALDLALLASDGPCSAAGMFTTNQVKAAPVLYDQATLANNRAGIWAVIANSSNANACTGPQGMQDAEAMAEATASALGCEPGDVLVLSTGVIGVPLPMDVLEGGIALAAGALSGDAGAGQVAAQAIMTTDTCPKTAAVEVALSGGTAIIAGMAKGAGMIHPNMATMLAVLVTDAAIRPTTLEASLRRAVEVSFNAISVDGDMSTNDTVLLLANGASGVEVGRADVAAFDEGLTAACTLLAQAIVRDGEGATRFITVRVTGGRSVGEARSVAEAIGRSPLVKTAFYGGDANWGRVLAAAGAAGVPLEQECLTLWYDDLQLVGGGVPLDYDEATANAIAGQDEITVRLDLGLGRAEATLWTCDLTDEYVHINGHYRS
jgi:glutamate N-acetyltransferase/amino-acid N-acetyltransferase